MKKKQPKQRDNQKLKQRQQARKRSPRIACRRPANRWQAQGDFRLWQPEGIYCRVDYHYL